MDEQFTVFNIPGVHITHPTTGVGHSHHHHHYHRHGQGHHHHIKVSCHHRHLCSSHFSAAELPILQQDQVEPSGFEDWWSLQVKLLLISAFLLVNHTLPFFHST